MVRTKVPNTSYKLKMRRVNKKGQMKIQQTAFMLIAITLLFVLVAVFFLSIRLYNLRKTASSLEEQSSLLLVSKLANSPEFSCGSAFGSIRTNCIDFDKVISLKDMVNEDSDLWGVSKIEIRKIYPSGDVICDKSNYPNCNIIEILNKEESTMPVSSNFVVLCRKETDGRILYDKCELAKLMVSSEEKRT